MNAGVILIGTFFLLLVLNVPIAWSIGCLLYTSRCV